MKLNRIVAACAAFGAVSAFAAGTVTSTCPTTPATATDLVANCAPEVTFYFGGASAQEPAVKAIMNAGGNGTFDTAKPIVRLVSTASTSSSHGAANSTAWYGFAPTTGKRTLVIYNKVNGSGAGLLQLLNGGGVAKLAGLTDASKTIQTQDAKSAAKGTPFTACTITHLTTAEAAPSLVTDTASCTNAGDFFSGWSGEKIMHAALADVEPVKLDPSLGIKKNGGTLVATAYQGFGLIVSPALYTALVAKQKAAGTLDASCSDTSTTAACQPNIKAADYAGLLAGTAKSAVALTGVADDAITVARRVKFSGTQAASNIFFMNQAGYNAKTALNSFATPLNTPDGLAGTVAPAAGSFVTTSVNAGTGDVITAVKTATGNAIGVVSLENNAAKVSPAKFVKLDGVSPDADTTGTLGSSLNRVSLQSGYPFQFQMAAVKHAKLAAGTATMTIADNIISALTDSTKSNLAGIAYEGSTDAAKATSYGRVGSNNYAPLVRK